MVSLMYELLLQGLIQQSSHNSSVLAPPIHVPMGDMTYVMYPLPLAKPRVYERRKALLARLYYIHTAHSSS